MDKKENFDVELSVVRIISDHNKPHILRVDGCYFVPAKLKNNKVTQKSIKKSVHVVYQSNFSKVMCDRIMGSAKAHTSIIKNGIDFNYIDKIKPNTTIVPGSFVEYSASRDRRFQWHLHLCRNGAL